MTQQVLWINQKKIDEQLRKNPPSYTVSAVNIEPQVHPFDTTLPPAIAHTAVNVLPPAAEAAHQRLIDLRRKLVESGRKLLSGEELDRTIEEIRGRSRSA